MRKTNSIRMIYGEWNKLDTGHYSYPMANHTYFATALRRTDWRLICQHADGRRRYVGTYRDLQACKEAARTDQTAPSKKGN